MNSRIYMGDAEQCDFFCQEEQPLRNNSESKIVMRMDRAVAKRRKLPFGGNLRSIKHFRRAIESCPFDVKSLRKELQRIISTAEAFGYVDGKWVEWKTMRRFLKRVNRALGDWLDDFKHKHKNEEHIIAARKALLGFD